MYWLEKFRDGARKVIVRMEQEYEYWQCYKLGRYCPCDEVVRRFPISIGMLPLRLLLPNFIFRNIEQSPIPIGIGPPSLLLEISNSSRLMSPPIVEGTDPIRPNSVGSQSLEG